MRFLHSFVLFMVLLLFAIFSSTLEAQVSKGGTAPAFNLRNSDGALVKPFQGSKPVLISFFFTDCANCKKEIKELESLNEKYNDRVTIYLIGTSFKNDVDVSDDVSRFIKDLGVNFIPLVDRYKDVIRSYGVSKYPSVFLINGKGKVVFTSSSYNENTIKDLEKQIKSIK